MTTAVPSPGGPGPGAAAGAAVLAQELGAFAAAFTLDDVPEADALVERVRWHVLDSAGLALSSWTAEDGFADKLLAAQREVIGAGACTVAGRAESLPAPAAAFLNGSLIHGSDYDDVHALTVMHCEGFATAAMLAVAERDDLSGRELVEAWIVATEVAIRLASAPHDVGGLFPNGFHNTAVFGTLGVAAGVSRLLGLGAEQAANAMALAVSFASGTSVGWLQASGRNKPPQAGWAARSGIAAAELAATGYACSLRTIDGPRGLLDAHTMGHGWSPEPIVEGLGSEWRTLQTAIKLYPCGMMCQATAECADVLVSEHGIRPEEVLSGRLTIPEQFWPVVEDMGPALHRPPSGFAMIGAYPCIVARTIVSGRYGLEHQVEAAARDPRMLEVADRIAVLRDDDSGHLPVDERPTTLELETTRGTFAHAVGRDGGQPGRLGRDRVVAKFRDNASQLVGEEQAGRIEEAALAVDRLGSARELAGLLRVGR
ncbi:MAG TPA: MmgE/PrpD family protein [Solirubrobacteraceae bacterium]|nr:MmgE/PrpD family protein [Solirubrobacteraceae bacterium]